MALFTRRSRAGWLDELDGIRGEALHAPDGEVASAMSDVSPLPPVAAALPDTSPLAELEAPLPPADPQVWDRAAARRAALRPAPPAMAPAAPIGEAAPAAEPEPVIEPEPVPSGPLSWNGAGAEAVVVEAMAMPASTGTLPSDGNGPDPVVARSELPPPPAAPLALPPATIEPTTPEVVAEPVVVQPSPHPIRPHEMWHPQVVVAAVAPLTEERLDPADLVGEADGGTAARFRFARLRAVAPSGEGLVQPVAPADGDPSRPPAPRAEEDLFGADRPAGTDGAPLGLDTAPLVPNRPAGPGGALITGPVARRRNRDDGHDRRWTDRAATEPDVGPESADAAAAASLAAEPAWRWVPEDEPLDAPAAVEPEPVAVEPEPEVIEAAAAPPRPVADDGTVDVEAGILRLAPGLHPDVVEGEAGLELALPTGWCWTDRPDGATAVVVELAVGRLTVPAGCAALAVVDADGSSFVVVVGGEAHLQHDGGRMRLRAGAMALTPPGGEPVVDVASDAEILSDPLVQQNLRLDAQLAS